MRLTMKEREELDRLLHDVYTAGRYDSERDDAYGFSEEGNMVLAFIENALKGRATPAQRISHAQQEVARAEAELEDAMFELSLEEDRKGRDRWQRLG